MYQFTKSESILKASKERILSHFNTTMQFYNFKYSLHFTNTKIIVFLTTTPNMSIQSLDSFPSNLFFLKS